jgi:catechol 2,3-dioxygenase-like lactoylglutathione lyase family enzyme
LSGLAGSTRAMAEHPPAPLPRSPVQGLDHVVIAVSEWKRSNAFYLDDPPRWRYRFGDQQLNVHGPGMDPQPVARIPAEPGMADLCFVWHGPIEEAIAHLERKGVEVEEGPVPRNGAQGPGHSVYFRDPDGSLLEFIAYE